MSVDQLLQLEQIRYYDKHAAMADAMAGQIAMQLMGAVEQRGFASIAFSGGNTPKLLFNRLLEQPVEWSKVHITLVDERCVAETDARSNARLLKYHLIDKLVSQPEFYPLYMDGESEAAKLRRLDNFPLPFDVVHLGMGEDAHTASFFPDADNIIDLLDINNNHRLLSMQSSSSVEHRLTWSLPSLLTAKQIFLHTCGDSKRHLLNKLLPMLGEADKCFDEIQLDYPVLAVLRYTTLACDSGVPINIFHAEEC